MAGGVAHDDDDGIADINIIPFVDIVLVLLVIFLLTSSIIARAAVEVELPAATNVTTPDPEVVHLALDTDGTISVDGAPVAQAKLVEVLRALRRPGLQVVITADKTSRYEQVIELVDASKAAGLERFGLSVDRKSEGPSPSSGNTTP